MGGKCIEIYKVKPALENDSAASDTPARWLTEFFLVLKAVRFSFFFDFVRMVL